MRLRLQLMSGVRLEHADSGIVVPLRSYAKIFAALGFAECPLARHQLVALVWPEVAPQAGRNRLRVALTKLRMHLPDAVLETDAGLQLDLNIVEVDAAAIRDVLERSQDAVSAQDELEILMEMLELVGAGDSFDRHLPLAREFGELAAQGLSRLAVLAMDASKPELAMRAARSATHLNPDSAEAWSLFAVSHRKSHGTSALRELNERAPAAVRGDPLVRESLAQTPNAGPVPETHVTQESRSFWLDMLGMLEAARPEIMRIILSTPESLPIAGRYPRVMHDFLSRAVATPPKEEDETWHRCVARLVGLKAWLGDAQGVKTLATPLLDSARDPMILRAVWNAVAVAHSLTCDWEKAFQALDQAREYAVQIGSEIYQNSARGNAAYFKIQQALYDEADADYELVILELAQMGTPQAEFEHAIAHGNRSLIPIFRGDWPRALRDLEKTIELRSKPGLSVQMGIPQACLALARLHCGRRSEIFALMRQAFLDAFQSDSIRSQQFTFEIAANVLSGLDESRFAEQLVHWVGRWRDETSIPRSTAESAFVQHLCPKTTVPEIDGTARAIGGQVMKRLRLALAKG